MKVYILDQTLECENSKNQIEEIFKEINEKISNNNVLFSHLIIDGSEVYGEFDNYILENINQIKEIKVVTKTLKEVAQETLLSTLDYIERANPEIEALSNEFYKTPEINTWKKLTELIEGINWIMSTFTYIDSNPNLKNIVISYENWNLYAKDIYSLKELIVEFEEIMENGDLVSLADILSYEIVPLFNSMKDKLETLVSQGKN
ncbi:hypothetical protein RH915_09735 [Serpentinicella sp. ANB-PHB4]|uniref:hypothetical protein n=1 Tax=Serpentinicella sp. ANB-PHB4 TaxID=3074076 RepID=UPI0028617BBC|nr:hypothetical protein [Serpentinicella sp. ANB-PHB4]MDR5659777.1 hypothetical protein [Serpentinicella sp. ANB-PHB4]